MLPVYEPYLDREEAKNLAECVDSGWVSYLGPFVKELESQFKDYLQVTNATALNSGTAALHLALHVLGVGEGDKVLLPDLTFVASAFAVSYTGAEPIFCDIDPQTWTLDVADAARKLTPDTKAIIPVHLFGHPCEMDELMSFARENDLLVIEDAAQSLGSLYKGKHMGTFGDAGCFSFNGNKLVTSGGGGMVVFADDVHAKRALHLSTQAKEEGGRFVHAEIGYNYRMTNIQAAVGVAQFGRMEKVIERHRKRSTLYIELLDKIGGLTFRENSSDVVTNEWLMCVLLDDEISLKRDDIISDLWAEEIMVRPFFDPMSRQLPFQTGGVAETGPHTLDISARGLNLPSSYQLTDDDISMVCGTIEKVLNGLREA